MLLTFNVSIGLLFPVFIPTAKNILMCWLSSFLLMADIYQSAYICTFEDGDVDHQRLLICKDWRPQKFWTYYMTISPQISGRLFPG